MFSSKARMGETPERPSSFYGQTLSASEWKLIFERDARNVLVGMKPYGDNMLPTAIVGEKQLL